MTRLCILLSALAVIGRTRVPVLPGWVVPLPVLLTAGLLAGVVIAVTWALAARPRTWTPATAAEAAPETEGTAQ